MKIDFLPRVFGERSEDKDWVEFTPELSVKRREVVESVLTDGVLSGEHLLVQGKTYFPRNIIERSPEIYGGIFKIDNGRLAEGSMIALYNDSQSVFPVIGERGDASVWTRHDLKKRTMEKRVNSSALVVCRARDEELLQWRLAIRQSPVKPAEIVALLVPEQLYEDGYSNKDIIPVGTIRRGVWYDHYKFDLPDYESHLVNLVKTYGVLWGHGVRLPTREDLLKV